MFAEFGTCHCAVTLFQSILQKLFLCFAQDHLWNGNKERLWTHFFTRESLFLWALQTYGRRRREYPILFSQPQNAHLEVIHFRSPGQTENWFNQLPVDQPAIGV